MSAQRLNKDEIDHLRSIAAGRAKDSDKVTLDAGLFDRIVATLVPAEPIFMYVQDLKTDDATAFIDEIEKMRIQNPSTDEEHGFNRCLNDVITCAMNTRHYLHPDIKLDLSKL